MPIDEIILVIQEAVDDARGVVKVTSRRLEKLAEDWQKEIPAERYERLPMRFGLKRVDFNPGELKGRAALAHTAVVKELRKETLKQLRKDDFSEDNLSVFEHKYLWKAIARYRDTGSEFSAFFRKVLDDYICDLHRQRGRTKAAVKRFTGEHIDEDLGKKGSRTTPDATDGAQRAEDLDEAGFPWQMEQAIREMRRNGGPIPKEEMGRCMLMFLEAFSPLPKAKKLVFMARRVQKLSYSEIATLMAEHGVVDQNGKPRNGVAWRQAMHRAEIRLAENFEQVLQKWKSEE